jgi:flagellar FliJ protein
MGYQFKLEALRRYRQFEEERLQKELSDAQRSLEQAQAVLSAQIAGRHRCEEEFASRLREGVTAPQTTLYHSYLQRLSNEIGAQRVELQSLQKACELVREALATAMKKRKMLDRLKEKGEHAFLADLNSAEQKFINEIALNRFTLKKR